VSQPRAPAIKSSIGVDVLAEGLVSEKNRGDKTPLELFLAGIRGWDAEIRLQLTEGESQ
jgi:hypothetical protein